LIEYKEIKTTTEKAKETRSTVERLITYAKKGDLHHRRLAFAFLGKKDSIKILFDEIAPAFSDRAGGYTRVLKLGRRHGDAAAMALLQLVGFEKISQAAKTKSEKKKKTKKDKETPDKKAETSQASADKSIAEDEDKTAKMDDAKKEEDLNNKESQEVKDTKS
jgi:large subunit ribosomal protein L17